MLTINNTLDGWLQNIEIKGNTIQDAIDLTDIKSTGDFNGSRYEIPLLCVGKNLIDKSNMEYGNINSLTGELIGTGDAAYLRTKDYIKLMPNKNYSWSSSFGNDSIFVVVYYNDKKEFIASATSGALSPSNAKYIKLRVRKSDSSAITQADIDSLEIQLEEETIATTYEPYQRHELTILSDYQIEKIGTVADRIIEKDGVWGIEKNVGEGVLDGTHIYADMSTNPTWQKDNTFRVAYSGIFNIKSNLASSQLGCINTLSTPKTYADIINSDIEGVGVANTTATYVNLSLLKSKITTNINDYLKNNPIRFKYLQNPTFIPLSDAQQVALRTFANKTNILSLCEIEPTIKGSVPKSTSASISSINTRLDSVDKDLERVKKLEDATTSTVITDNNFMNISDTANGYLSDVKLEGRTEVNKLGSDGSFENVDTLYNRSSQSYSVANNELTFTMGESGSAVGVGSKKTIIVDKTKAYTVVWQSKNINGGNTYVRVLEGSWDNVGITIKTSSTTTSTTYKLDKMLITPTDLATTNGTLHLYYRADGVTNSTSNFKDVMVLEGDYTDKDMSYFEGLASVGDGTDKLVVSSVESTIKLENGTIGSADGIPISSSTRLRCSDYLEYNSIVGTDVKHLDFNKYEIIFFLYDKDKNFIKSNNVFITDNIIFDTFGVYYKFAIRRKDSSAITIDTENLNLYQSILADKKEILYLDTIDDTWKKPTLRGIWNNGELVVGDTGDKHSDGKYYYHKRMGEIVLDGSISINDSYVSIETDSCKITISTPIKGKYLDLNSIARIINDKVKVTSLNLWANTDEVSISMNSTGEIVLRTPISYGTTASEIKTSLGLNPITAVYQLAEEQIYECTPLDLASFDSETNYYNESGVLSPRSTIKVQNYVGNIINTLKEKVSILENTVYQTSLATFAIGLNVLNQQG